MMLPLRITFIILVVLQTALANFPVPIQEDMDLDQPIGEIKCGEVLAYIQALDRFYSRKCQRKGDACHDKDSYPGKWFKKVNSMIMGMCQKLGMYPEEQRVAKPAMQQA